MLAVRRRFGAPILLTTSFLFTVILLFSNSGVTTTLLNVPRLGTGLWKWNSQSGDESLDGVQLVVFGDSWADNTIEKGQEGKETRWTDALCSEFNCTSQLNFATSQPSFSFPKSPPTGVVTSNEVHNRVLTTSRILVSEQTNFTLPDLATQIQSFTTHSTSPSRDRSSTVFVISVGFWDVYHFAGVDYTVSPHLIDASITAFFAQLDILYTHFLHSLTPPTSNATTFRLVILKILDPTLAPGWQTQRPLPISPSSIAEQQKNAVYLTKRWNLGVESRLIVWMKGHPLFELNAPGEKGTEVDQQPTLRVEKDIYYHDLPTYVLDTVVERSLEIEGLSDADGLGKGESPFNDVYLSCVSDDGEIATGEEKDGYEELNGKWVCKNPAEYLWWDGWTLGGVAGEEVGMRVAGLVKTGDSFGKAWGELEI